MEVENESITPVTDYSEAIETIEDEKTKLNNAIKKLYKNNKNLASDLTKLAEISETNPSMFNMLLNSLRNL